jgi:hypothetical protein
MPCPPPVSGVYNTSALRKTHGSVVLKNSIVYEPYLQEVCEPYDPAQPFVSASYNVIYPHPNGPGGPCALDGTTDLVEDARLEPQLTYNSPGKTATHALLPNSPARDRIPNNTAIGSASLDQRGISRPQGPHLLPAFDVGAYEMENP